MTKMVGKTNRAQHADCFHGNKCCASSLYMAGKTKSRRIVKRGERQGWKREARDYR